MWPLQLAAAPGRSDARQLPAPRRRAGFPWKNAAVSRWTEKFVLKLF